MQNQNPTTEVSTMEWSRGHRIGHGSFGSVNLAIPRNRTSTHTSTTTLPPLMAVKSASVFNSGSLENERQVLGQLSDCPNVIRCFGEDYSSENGERLYNMFLEYASRGSLADQLKKSGGKLPEFDVRRYTKSVLKGLRYIHVNGFVHCDIKIQNILLCSENGNDSVKIADFGLAKRAKSREETGFRGTPLNMSPESVTGGEYESPADIWALGCAVVEMMTGKPAWRCLPNSDVNSLLLRIGIGAELPEIPEKLSEEGKDFLRKCFVKDQRKRWTAEMLLNHPFIAAVVDDDDDEDEDYTVPLKVEYEEASTSPRCPFDFPDWVSMQSPSVTTPSSIFLSPVSDTQSSEELNSWSVSSSIYRHNSPENRLRQLVSDQKPDWSISESWVTVR